MENKKPVLEKHNLLLYEYRKKKEKEQRKKDV